MLRTTSGVGLGLKQRLRGQPGSAETISTVETV